MNYSRNKIHGGVMLLTPQLIVEMLHLPEDTKIIGAEWQFHNGNLKLYIIHEDIVPSYEGSEFPSVQPIYEFKMQKEITFKGWN